VPSIDINAEDLIARLMAISESETVCILDSCGVSQSGSHLLIAGLRPVEVFQINDEEPAKILDLLDSQLNSDLSAIFTLSYDLGLKLHGIRRRAKEFVASGEPDLFLAMFDCLIVHDYKRGETHLVGNEDSCSHIEILLRERDSADASALISPTRTTSNFTRSDYLKSVAEIQELIRSGDTYQTNLTQQLKVDLPESTSPQQVFTTLRRDHPAPFAAFIQRPNSTVISVSPERFFSINDSLISASPIKGTRRRGESKNEDDELRRELLASEKDVAENTMIVDLLRNDLGRVCEYGSVGVEKLCELEEHPTLFHLVSTIKGKLREDARFSEVLKALFPCGSITGAPKHRTMQIIDRIETVDRGLSMGAIGISVSPSHVSGSNERDVVRRVLDFDVQLSVAIRTMVIRDNVATFNVGGGIVIDSLPEMEYEESLLKAKALLKALNAELDTADKNNALGTHS
jgi:para-aminobenzoate synthetase component 1